MNLLDFIFRNIYMSMKSNFEFLNKNELTQQYFVRSNQAEQSYAIGIVS